MNYGALMQDDTLQIFIRGKILNITQIRKSCWHLWAKLHAVFVMSVFHEPPSKVLTSFVEAPIKNCITVLLVKQENAKCQILINNDFGIFMFDQKNAIFKTMLFLL